MGVALALPQAIAPADVARTLGPLLGTGPTGELQRLRVFDGSLLDWELEADLRSTRPAALQPEIDGFAPPLPHPSRPPLPARRGASGHHLSHKVCEQDWKHSRPADEKPLDGGAPNVGMGLLQCNINYGSAARPQHAQNG
jgi:hypothetical protein